MPNSVLHYLELIKKEFSTGHAREHSYRPFLKELVESINEKINAVNEPKQQKVGAPDFVLLRGKTLVGYIEAKDITVDLDKELKSRNQVNRYKSSLGNLCFTNYLEFRFYLNGEETERIEIAKLKDKQIEIFEDKLILFESLLKNFTLEKSITIKNAKELALLMANKAKMLKNVLYLSLEDKTTQDGKVEKQYEVFKQMLIHDLTTEQFSDIYAQTVAYGMFAARYHDPTIESFTRDEANTLLPKSNPFLRNFFQSIAGYNIDDRIVWMVDDLADLFNYVDVKELLANFGKETMQEDVIIHFYETFLAEYDSKLRKSRGVYYTPEPVVSFIVRAVDDILKTEFDIPYGITDESKIDVLKEVQGKTRRERTQEHRVQILDPATGTGTFLDHVVKYIYKTRFDGQEGSWQDYVDDHLLPRLHGFEILMASYAMAHLKLDITLSETGYDFAKGSGKRLGIYLTNSLEEPEKSQRDLFSQWLSEESAAANEVKKEKPIMVVIGNPPYSVSSSNKGEWIESLMQDYKKDLNEKNIQPLSDDYIKFIRYAQWLIDKNGEGIVAYISNNSFIDGIIHRKMRKSLLKSFDKMYILDLHGNSKKKETAPDGGKDENVFDIQQGVSINIFVKKKNANNIGKQTLFHELYGLREEKYSILVNKNLSEMPWKAVKVNDYKHFFKYVDTSNSINYDQYTSISDIFISTSTGINTEFDELVIQNSKEQAQCLLSNLKQKDIELVIKEYDLDIKKMKKIQNAQRDITQNKYILTNILYRPFDERYTLYTGNSNGIMGRPRGEVMRHFLNRNIGLVTMRQYAYNQPQYDYVFLSTSIATSRVFISNKGYCSLIPLYLYSDSHNNLLGGDNRNSNIQKDFIHEFSNKLDLQFISDHRFPSAGKKGTFHSLDIFDYIYAILHSPTYRIRYKEFLKIDFPRIPLTSSQKLFWKLVKKGHDLRKFHLMEHEKSSDLITKYPIAGQNEVNQVDYKNEKVFINDEQYFEGVPEIAWNFYIGGYQPAQKWLKDRKKAGRSLGFEDVLHYQKIIVALVNTDRLMKEIDEVIPEWPIK